MAFQQEYFAIPPITRAYTTTCLLTTIAVVSEIYIKFSYHYSALFNRTTCSAISFAISIPKAQLFIYNRIKYENEKREKKRNN